MPGANRERFVTLSHLQHWNLTQQWPSRSSHREPGSAPRRCSRTTTWKRASGRRTCSRRRPWANLWRSSSRWRPRHDAIREKNQPRKKERPLTRKSAQNKKKNLSVEEVTKQRRTQQNCRRGSHSQCWWQCRTRGRGTLSTQMLKTRSLLNQYQHQLRRLLRKPRKSLKTSLPPCKSKDTPEDQMPISTTLRGMKKKRKRDAEKATTLPTTLKKSRK